MCNRLRLTCVDLDDYLGSARAPVAGVKTSAADVRIIPEGTSLGNRKSAISVRFSENQKIRKSDDVSAGGPHLTPWLIHVLSES